MVGYNKGHFRLPFCVKGPLAEIRGPQYGLLPAPVDSLLNTAWLRFGPCLVLGSGPESSAGSGVRAEKPKGRDRHRPGAERHRRHVLGCDG